MSLEALSVDDIIDEINDLLDKSWGLPLSGGKCVVNSEKLRDLLEQISLSLPGEIRQAQNLVADRNRIIDTANETAKQITDRAEAKAKSLLETADKRAQERVSQERITIEAQEYAQNILKDTNVKVRELKQSALTFAQNLLIETEREYRDGISKLVKARENLVTAGDAPVKDGAAK